MSIKLIQTVSLANNAVTIDFTNVPQTYTDLLLIFSLRDDRSGNSNSPVGLNINGVATNRSGKDIQAIYNGGANQVYSGTYTNNWIGYCNGATATTSTFGVGQVLFSNYANNSNKLFSVETIAELASSSGHSLDFFAGVWANTAAITSLSLNAPLAATGFVTGCSASLYGITKGSGGASVA